MIERVIRTVDWRVWFWRLQAVKQMKSTSDFRRVTLSFIIPGYRLSLSLSRPLTVDDFEYQARYAFSNVDTEYIEDGNSPI